MKLTLRTNELCVVACSSCSKQEQAGLLHVSCCQVRTPVLLVEEALRLDPGCFLALVSLPHCSHGEGCLQPAQHSTAWHGAGRCWQGKHTQYRSCTPLR
jgi:hypothetical protein